MASRMKKIFNRKKDDDTEKPQQHLRAPAPAGSDPAIRTSLYESTTAAGLPQTGDYPIKGNDSSVVLQAGRKSSVRSMRSRRSSSRGSQYNTPYQAPAPSQHDGPRKTPRMSPPPPSNAANPGLYDPYQGSAFPMGGQDDKRKRWSRTPLPQEFAGLSLGDGHGPTTVTETVTTTRTPHQGPISNRSAPQSQGAAYQNHNAGYKAPSRDPPLQPHASREGNSGQEQTTHNIPDSGAANQQDERMPSTSKSYKGDFTVNSRSNDFSGQREYDTDLARQRSIPRKEVGSSIQAPYLPTQSSTSPSAQIGHGREPRASKPLPSAPIPLHNGHEAHSAEAPIQPTSILDRSRPVSRGLAPPRDAQDVVNRAKTNTFDTEVIEKVAPAVVHESVSKEVHHIRQEVITREIHTHDVYHRILPVIDVEVLPPRHFLPVEGGGLVEVSASEVPGRGQNWVIAETASKIPSDQAAPQGARQFTARNFPGREGDSVTYKTPEGHERTETTWIHPPELEQGARVTGQSWPMEFGDNALEKGSHGNSTPKSTKRKSPKKSAAVQASPAQRAGGLGRAM